MRKIYCNSYQYETQNKQYTMISIPLTCKECQTFLHVVKQNIILECPKCGFLGKWKAS